MSLWVLILIALKLNYFHIIPDAGKLSRVHEPIAVTTTAEFLFHWGAHLVVLALGVLFLAPCVIPVFVLAGACVLALFYDKAGALMLLLFVATAIQGLMRSEKGTEIRWSDACTYALLLSGLGLVLIPEFVFLDDAYGGPDERMNTIFKSYTTAWGLLGLGCSALVVRAWRHSATCPAEYKFSERLMLSVVVVAYVVGTVYPGSGAAFGFYGPILRQRVMADAPESGVEGLGQVDRDKPGAAALIRTLRGLPRGRVLESQGNPYSYTTFISTLAAQPSYLGWANHLHLLSKVVGEVDRRIGVTSRIYSSDSCLERRELARSELIRYIVVGSNERAQYPELAASDFDCFEKLTETGDYLLYGVGS